MLTFLQFNLEEAFQKPHHGFKPQPQRNAVRLSQRNAVRLPQRPMGGGIRPKNVGPKKTPASKGSGFLNALMPPRKMKNPLLPSKASLGKKNPFLAKPKKKFLPNAKKKMFNIPKTKMLGMSGIKRPKPLATMLGGWAKKKLGW